MFLIRTLITTMSAFDNDRDAVLKSLPEAHRSRG